MKLNLPHKIWPFGSKSETEAIKVTNEVHDIFEGLNLEPQPVDYLKLDHIVTIGRKFFEYNSIFLLDELDPFTEKILDVGGGVSSFTYEAVERGFEVMSVDPIYAFDHYKLARKCEEDIEYSINNLEKTTNMINWGKPIENFEHLRHARQDSYRMFLDDFRKNRWRYLDAQFPYTPFIVRDNFTVSLVSHLLFIYDNHINYDTHVSIIKEILRVTSKEIRIYPIINLGFKTSEFVGRIMKDPLFAGVSFELRPTEYMFLKGADKMMVIKKSD
jgi:hypothetical protein